MFVDAFSRLVAATLSAAFCFALWDLASRNPDRIAADVRNALRSVTAGLRGALRFAVGAVFASIALVLVTTVAERGQFSLVAIAVFLGGLGVDALIGDGIRAGIGIRS